MKPKIRIAAVFFLQILTLLILAKLIGNPIMSAAFYLTSPAACIGYMVDFRFMIGATVAVFATGVFLDWKSAKRSSIRSFFIATAIVDLVYATHMKTPFCS